MRGPSMDEFSDPLFDWIQARHDVDVGVKPYEPTDPKDVSRLLEKMDHALRSDNMGGDSPTDAVYEIPRPAIHHLGTPGKPLLALDVPDPMSYSNEDPDDDEGGLPSVRISPCTFLAWAEGCKRWDHEFIKDPSGLLVHTARCRPQDPIARDKDHYPAYLKGAQSQVDKNTGEEFSPFYNVPQNPSLIWSPPGVADDAYAPATFLRGYNLMLPLDGKKRLDRVYGRQSSSVPAAGTNEHYGNTEVDEAVVCMDDELPNGMTIKEFVEAREDSIKFEEAKVAGNQAAINAQEATIKELTQERDQLRTLYIPLLHHRRAERILHLQTDQQSAKESRIRAHVSAHVRETQVRLDNVYVRHAEVKARREQNARAIERLQIEIDEECLLVGKTSPKGIYNEIEALSSPVPSLKSTNEDGNLDGIGQAHGGGLDEPGYLREHQKPSKIQATGPEREAETHKRWEQRTGQRFRHHPGCICIQRVAPLYVDPHPPSVPTSPEEELEPEIDVESVHESENIDFDDPNAKYKLDRDFYGDDDDYEVEEEDEFTDYEGDGINRNGQRGKGKTVAFAPTNRFGSNSWTTEEEY
ncbi:uncharacterized protein F4822DRAFT_429508 [Hypoxylon trugodes]|uniref:uncharacterized protein n=1 Tax=Hypoxylon trugodes TaxID=326681 RepID=UPI002191BB24|nr:uncharacterized protein F4822DRAFT_429508 [Hypoxylon trugodes]KAI1388892.1 hypothetical protein F4822DRAFT_429508 [Hypoxylon trugodes]